jgi:putative hemolysin
MPLAARLENYFDAEARRAHSKHRLRVRFADSLEDLRAAQRLRHRVFIEEMGARLPLAEPGIESDRFDHYCEHLLVWDEDTDQAVGCYRILTDSQAVRAGGYHAQSEFDLTRVLAVPGRLLEVGRTCVHPDYRNGAVIGLLWSGLARFMLMHRYDYLMGCASIPLGRKSAPACSALPPSMAVSGWPLIYVTSSSQPLHLPFMPDRDTDGMHIEPRPCNPKGTSWKTVTTQPIHPADGAWSWTRSIRH